MDGSNGKIVSLLERMANGMDALRESQEAFRKETRQEIQGLRQEMAGMRVDMRRGFEQVNARMDNMIDFMGRHHADHEDRIRVLEERVLGKPSGSTS
jgi:hypothetical protein